MSRFLAAALMAWIAGCTEKAPEEGSALRVVEAYVEAWNERDSTALDTLLAANGIHEDPAQGFRAEGPAEVVALWRGLDESMPDFHWRITRSFTDGSDVGVEWSWVATYSGPTPEGPVADLPIEARGAALARVEDGRIVRFVDYYDGASFFSTGSEPGN